MSGAGDRVAITDDGGGDYLAAIDYDIRRLVADIESGDGAEDSYRYWLAQLYSRHNLQPEWMSDQFSAWYSRRPDLWQRIDLGQPMAAVSGAFHAWMRRP